MIKGFLTKEPLLLAFSMLLIPLIFFSSEMDYANLIDWRTIFSMAGLLLVSKGLEESGYFERFVWKHAHRFGSERSLAIFLITSSFFLSTFMTNDITLFIVVPLTLAFGSSMNLDTGKIIVFEALAVNSGSALSPIGNPQNIFLWGISGESSMQFLLTMLPLGVFLFLSLILFAFLSFKPVKIKMSGKDEKTLNRPLLWMSLAFFPVLMLSIDAGLVFFVFPFILLAYLLFRPVIYRADWPLIALFILMFLDFGLLAAMPEMNGLGASIASSPFLYSVLLSQFMSNVPSAIFVSSFSSDWKSIAYGVNLAGNGLVIASMANIIALRLAKRPLLREFHRYSIPFFAITFTVLFLTKLF